MQNVDLVFKALLKLGVKGGPGDALGPLSDLKVSMGYLRVSNIQFELGS